MSSRPLTPTQPGSRETIPSSWAPPPCLRASPASWQAARMENLNSPTSRRPIPAQYGQPFANTASSGLGYASFLLGRADGLQLAPPRTVPAGHAFLRAVSAGQLEGHPYADGRARSPLGLCALCGPKNTAVCRMPTSPLLTRPRRPAGDSGIRANLQLYLRPAYRFSIGPHVGVAWQITPKTVFRAGGAINYAATADQAGLNVSVADFLALTAPGYGLPAAILKNGDPYAPGNVYGNPVLTFNNVLQSHTPAVSADHGFRRRASQLAVCFHRVQCRAPSANFPVEHRLPARDLQRHGGGSFLCGQSRRLVDRAAAVLAELQRRLATAHWHSKYGINIQNPVDRGSLD